MTLPAGVRLGCYEVAAKIGEGGMGEVYRARDTKLDREVALKVLPETLAGDRQRLDRLRREARVIAALNHPNIVTLFSIEETDETVVLVMELVDGHRLDHLLPATGFPLSELLPIVRALTDAIDAAHRAGIVHRDLKPANVMVTGDGRVKVLDFGLAKPVASPEVPPDDRKTVADASPLTEPATVLGTAAYMAPEQLRGEVVDGRADIFSLGVMLYELSTGCRPFQGRTLAEIGAAVLKDEPAPLSTQRPDLPRQLETIVRCCLAKDPGRRYATARDTCERHWSRSCAETRCGHWTHRQPQSRPRRLASPSQETSPPSSRDSWARRTASPTS